jgi:hypothetical protein
VLPFRVEEVLPSRSLEYFLSSQHWLDAFPPPMEPHYARLTAYLKTLLAADALDAAAVTPAVPIPDRTSASGKQPSAATLQRLEAELARYIGPVARLLVNRAATRASGLEALIGDLAAEIESEADRREFVRASQRSLRAPP